MSLTQQVVQLFLAVVVMNDTRRARSVLLQSLIFLIACLVVLGWLLSLAKALNWMLPLAVIAAVGVATFCVKQAGPCRNFYQALIEPFSYWPVILLMILKLIAAFAFPPTMLDSLTYRLPRIWLWLQENGVHHVISAEPRLNYLPQVWGLATLPLIQLAGDHLVWFWTFASWIIVYLVAYDWALDVSADVKKSRLMAFIVSTSAFALLQAGSTANDLFVTAMLLLSLRHIVTFEQTGEWRWISWAVLSFGLAAGTKPHYSVLGLPLVLWFFFAPSKPWKAFRWSWLPLLLPLWLLCSPVPSFVLNYRTYGSWAGRGQDVSMTGTSPIWNIVLGTTLITWHSLQPPINPLALTLNEPLEKVVVATGLNEVVPRFTLRSGPFSMVDGACLGLITSAMLAAGTVCALRRNRRVFRSWQGWAMLAGWLGIALALSRFVPGSAGRAYCGFLHLSFPFAILGWQSMELRTLRVAGYICLVNGLLLITFDPARPLWPAAKVQRTLASYPKFSGIAQKMNPYLLVQERARTGEEITRAIPAGESAVALIPEDRPLLPLFRPYGGHSINFLPPRSAPAEMERLGANYVIICEGADLDYPEICNHVESSADYEKVLERKYTSKLVRGAETWSLYRRRLPAKTDQ